MRDYADTAKAQASMGDPSSVTYALLAVCHRIDKLADVMADLATRAGETRTVDLEAPERTPPKFNPGGYVGGDYAIPEMPLRGCERVVTREEIRAVLDAKPCDDRTCTDRDHWAPRGPNQCDPGGRRWDDDGAPVAFACTATMPGHWCTRREHSDDRHVWAMSDEEAQRILRAGQELGFVEPDPLDESDHRPRHDRDGDHWLRWPDGWGQAGGWFTLAEVSSTHGPLMFCDCDDAATIEAENGATD